MKKMQRNFKNRNPDMASSSSNKAAMSMEVDDNSDGLLYDDDEEAGDEDDDLCPAKMTEFPVCLGPKRTSVPRSRPRRVTCMLCQEDELLSFEGESMVYAGFVQRQVDSQEEAWE